jgi:hypothetical protein
MELTSTAEALDRSIEAADQLGLDTTAAREAATRIAERAGYPGDLYVLALAGGTGVGKSSLLNAIAGTEVSRAGARRPTTSAPVAWVPADQVDDAAPLLDWLGGAELRARDSAGPAVAVLDLPDLDSVEPAHAARVDAVLPRVDAVLWVTDPEKYQDAVLHDAYLRRWASRLGRQALVINKADRLGLDDARRVRADLLERLAAEGLPPVRVMLVSATHGVDPLRAWLQDGAAAKEVVTARLVADARAAIEALARSAGVDAGGEPGPLVPLEARNAAIAATTREILAVIDLDGLQAQSVEAATLAARPRGGGPLGVARALVDRGTGTAERRADPEGFLRRWRERGSLARAAAPVRDVVTAALPSVPPEARAPLVAMIDPTALTDRFGAVIDRAVAGPAGTFQAPTSRVWPSIGVGQLIATAAVLIGVVWLLSLWVAGGAVPTPTVDVPFLGPMPTPAVLILGGLAGWFVLGRILRAHATRLGRGWADGVATDIRTEVRRVVDDVVSGPLAERDAARHNLWDAQVVARRDATGRPRGLG